jgi:hypothetical protein
VYTSVGLVDPHPHLLLDFLAAAWIHIFVHGEIAGPSDPAHDSFDRVVCIRIGNQHIRNVRQCIRYTATHVDQALVGFGNGLDVREVIGSAATDNGETVRERLQYVLKSSSKGHCRLYLWRSLKPADAWSASLCRTGDSIQFSVSHKMPLVLCRVRRPRLRSRRVDGCRQQCCAGFTVPVLGPPALMAAAGAVQGSRSPSYVQPRWGCRWCCAGSLSPSLVPR